LGLALAMKICGFAINVISADNQKQIFLIAIVMKVESIQTTIKRVIMHLQEFQMVKISKYKNMRYSK